MRNKDLMFFVVAPIASLSFFSIPFRSLQEKTMRERGYTGNGGEDMFSNGSEFIRHSFS